MKYLLVLFAIPVIGSLARVSNDPVLTPRGDGFESAGVFNPAVIEYNGRVVMLYRAQDRAGVSRLGYASSTDGIHFTREPQPVLSPEAPYEAGGGVEDPRLVRIENTFYLTYTGYNKKDAQLCLATSKDLKHWDRKGVILPAYQGKWNAGWTKSGAIFDRQVNGKYWMYFLGTTREKKDLMGVAYSSDLVHWTEALNDPVLPSRPGDFDDRVVEPGPPPVATKDGILLFYNGADAKLVYRAGWALFDATDPSKLLARSNKPILSPLLDWEKKGQVPNVVFVEGLLRKPGRWLFYYGGADRNVGIASLNY